MIKIIFLSVFIIFSQKIMAFGPNISNTTLDRVDENEINGLFYKAQQFFENEIGSLTSNINISIQDQGCFRTGYNYIIKEVVFCKTKDVAYYGLKSIDVINHEFFHAFLCNFKPNLCTTKINVEVHEGLADYFSYLLNPDSLFGEKYYNDFDFIRNYQTHWRQGLVQGDHAKGNILSSLLIANNAKLKDGLLLFDLEPISDQVEETIDGAAKSLLNRYRLRLGEELKIDIKFPSHPEVTKVSWRYPKGLSIEAPTPRSAIIKFIDTIPSTSVDAVFHSESGEEVGFRRYYFGLVHKRNVN